MKKEEFEGVEEEIELDEKVEGGEKVEKKQDERNIVTILLTLSRSGLLKMSRILNQ